MAVSISSNDDATAGKGSGGGIFTTTTLTIANSTFTGNSATYTGSGGDDVTSSGNGGGIYSTGTLAITNSTISGNTAAHPNSTGGTDGSGTGGGVFIFNGQGGTLTLKNTIVAGNTARLNRDLQGTVTGTFNLIGDGTGSTGLTNTVNGNKVGTLAAPIDPLLGPLANNGGATQTMALLGTSPAIDAGSNALALDPLGAPLATDQRGTGFSRIAGSKVDIGAFEAHPPTDIALSSTSIGESRPSGSTVGTLSSTGGSGTFTYSLVSGTGSTDNASFSISGSNLQTASALNFEAKSSFSIRLMTTDSTGGSFEKAFTITVINQAELAPTITGITTDTGTSASDGITNDPTLLIGGTSEPGMTITVSFNGSPSGTTTSDGTGAWTLDHSAVTLVDGTYSATAVATDTLATSTGPSSPFQIIVDTAAPTVNATATPTNAGFDTVHFTFSNAVTGFALGSLSMALGGVPFALTGATLTTSDDGTNWTLGGLASKTQVAGTYTVTVTPTGITDIAGNAMPLPAPFFNFVVAAATVPTVSFTTASQSVGEAGGPVTITAQLSVASANTVTVPLTISGTAAEAADYTLSSHSIVIAAGSTTGSVTLTPINNTVDAPDKTAVFGMGTPVNATLTGTITQTVTIVDDDAPTDTTPPTSRARVSIIKVKRKPFRQIIVVYTDPSEVDQATLGTGDIKVTGPRGSKFSGLPTKTKVVASADGTTVTVTYRIAEPTTKRGKYTVTLVANQVNDLLNNLCPKRTLGSFTK